VRHPYCAGICSPGSVCYSPVPRGTTGETLDPNPSSRNFEFCITTKINVCHASSCHVSKKGRKPDRHAGSVFCSESNKP
jgi:hypothetical protein